MTADRRIDGAQAGQARGRGAGAPDGRRAITARGTPLLFAFAAFAFAAFAMLTLSACGQKGPLYLPDSGGEVVTRPSGSQGQSGETAPQPSTQPANPQQQRSDDEKKSQTTAPR